MEKNGFLLVSLALMLSACGQTATGEDDASTASAEGEVTENSNESASAEPTETTWNAPSGSYTTDPGHRYITFSYLHQGYARPHIRWRDWTATLNWDSEAPEESSISVSINADSVDSGVDEFDGHLTGERFFDADNYPEITFVSSAIERIDGNKGALTGDLTIKGITKAVVLDVTFNKGDYDQRGNLNKLGFSASAEVKRSDFGIDAFVPYVGDEVIVQIEAEFVKPAE